jgi:MFS family permease
MYTIDWAALGRWPAKDASRSRFLPRVSPVVWALGFTSMLTDISSEMVGSILPAYLVLYLHISPMAFGVIDGVYQGFAALARVAAGVAGDAGRRHKLVAAIGYAVSAVCRLGMVAAGNGWSAIAAVVALDRTGKGIRTAPRDALIALHTTPAQLAQAFGVHRALDAAGAMLGPLVAFVILVGLPGAFDVVFVTSFCFAAIGLGVLVTFLDVPWGVRTDTAAASEATLTNARAMLRQDRRFLALAAIAGALSVATASDAFIFLSLQQRTQFNGGLFPLLFVAMSLVNFGCAVPAGRAADRWGRVRVFLLGHLLLLCVYAVLFIGNIGVPQIAACLVLLGAYYAATDGVLAAIAASFLPRDICGTGLAMLATVTNLGRLLASITFGFAWSRWGLDTATASFAAALTVVLVSAPIVLQRIKLSSESHVIA